MPWHPQILADQLNLSQLGGTDYAHLITTGTPEFSDLPTVLIDGIAMGDETHHLNHHESRSLDVFSPPPASY